MALKIHMAWCPEFSPVYKTMYGQIWLNILVHNDKKCAFVLSNHQCWEIQQVYTLSTTPGRMTLKGQWCIMLNIQCAFPRLFVHSPCLPRRSSSWAEHRDCDRGDWLHVICGHLLPEEGKDDHKALWWATQACSTHFQLVVNGLWWTHCITETVFSFFSIWFCVLCAVRSVGELSEPVLSKFEQLAENQNVGLAYLFSFPTYSMSKSTQNNYMR